MNGIEKIINQTKTFTSSPVSNPHQFFTVRQSTLTPFTIGNPSKGH